MVTDILPWGRPRPQAEFLATFVDEWEVDAPIDAVFDAIAAARKRG